MEGEADQLQCMSAEVRILSGHGGYEARLCMRLAFGIRVVVFSSSVAVGSGSELHQVFLGGDGDGWGC